MNDLRLEVSKIIDAPITKVFDAWLDPKALSSFMLPMPGMPSPETKIDAVKGGQFEIKMNVGDQIIPHTGSYLELDRPDKLTFTWNSPFSTKGSTVTILFKKADNSKTKINLTHTVFPDEESRENHEGGWNNILTKLNELYSESVSAA